MPAPVIYAPPAVRRYFGVANDPNSAAGGTNLETMIADATNFPGADIPDITNLWPVSTATAEWGTTRINRDNEISGVRAGRPEIPFKVSPVIPFTTNAYRYVVEKVLKTVLGVEGAITGTSAYEVDAVTITGAPTGGTFTLSFLYNGATYTTAGIAPSATAAAVAAAVQAATGGPALPANAVVGTGGSLPATVTLTFQNGMTGPVTSQAFASSLTGGTTPSGTFTRVTVGVVPGGFTHPLSAAPFGSGLLPSLNLQIIRDSVAHKATGAVLESVEITFPFDGSGTVTCESHPLYLRQEPSTVAMPTGVIPETAAQPMLIRDATVVFDNGATSTIGISQFAFGVKNNSQYNRQVAGHCIDQKTLGTPGLLRQLWFPHYHKISGRHTVTFGLNFLDAQEAQETAMQWGQVQKVVVTVADPLVPGNNIVFTLFATEVDGGGVDALQASGDQTAAFTGRAFYSASDGSDIQIAVNNQSATPI